MRCHAWHYILMVISIIVIYVLLLKQNHYTNFHSQMKELENVITQCDHHIVSSSNQLIHYYLKIKFETLKEIHRYIERNY